MNHLPEFEGNMNLLHFSGSEQTGEEVQCWNLVWSLCSTLWPDGAIAAILCEVSCVVITVTRLILSAETAHTCSDKGILHTSEIIRSLYFFILM